MIKVEYKRSQPVIKDPDRVCTICEKPYKAVSPLQKTCSDECRKVKNKGNRDKFHTNNEGKHKEYNKTRLERKPNYWKDKYNQERNEVIVALGGECIACGNKNPLHLHLDYIPTMRGKGGFRHPRHKRWMLDNLKDFRVLCANHHTELTLTGRIDGTQITQNIIQK